MSARLVKVYEVLYDTGRGGGAAGDGSAIYRSKSQREAAAFAAGKTYCGNPTSVACAEVPRRLAERWGVA